MEPHHTETVRWLGESLGFWIQTGALFLSAIGALWIVRSRERSERRRATVELVIHHNNDKDLRTAKDELLKLIHAREVNFARFLSQKESDEYKAIIKILNTHEFVCGGIRLKAYDEKLYKQMQCAVIVRDWEALAGFVKEFRNSKRGEFPSSTDTATFYQDLEWIAEKWDKNPLKTGRYYWWWPRS